MKDHKDLDVWKKSVEAVTEIYTLTRCFPKEEIYGLTNQMRRSAVSIPSNVAAGAARQSEKEFVHFLYIAFGSAAELETQLIVAKQLGFVQDVSSVLCKVVNVQKMLNGLICHYRNKT